MVNLLIKNISKTYENGVEALKNVSLEISNGINSTKRRLNSH